MHWKFHSVLSLGVQCELLFPYFQNLSYVTATIFTGIPVRIRESDLLGCILYFISGRKKISTLMNCSGTRSLVKSCFNKWTLRKWRYFQHHVLKICWATAESWVLYQWKTNMRPAIYYANYRSSYIRERLSMITWRYNVDFCFKYEW